MNPPAPGIRQAYWWWAHLFISLARALCVIMAVVSLCHFCDRLSRCKSAAKDSPRPHAPRQVGNGCIPISSATSFLFATPRYTAMACGRNCMFCVEWQFPSSTCFDCAVQFSWEETMLKGVFVVFVVCSVCNIWTVIVDFRLAHRVSV